MYNTKMEIISQNSSRPNNTNVARDCLIIGAAEDEIDIARRPTDAQHVASVFAKVCDVHLVGIVVVVHRNNAA